MTFAGARTRNSPTFSPPGYLHRSHPQAHLNPLGLWLYSLLIPGRPLGMPHPSFTQAGTRESARFQTTLTWTGASSHTSTSQCPLVRTGKPGLKTQQKTYPLSFSEWKLGIEKQSRAGKKKALFHGTWTICTMVSPPPPPNHQAFIGLSPIYTSSSLNQEHKPTNALKL